MEGDDIKISATETCKYLLFKIEPLFEFGENNDKSYKRIYDRKQSR